MKCVKKNSVGFNHGIKFPFKFKLFSIRFIERGNKLNEFYVDWRLLNMRINCTANKLKALSSLIAIESIERVFVALLLFLNSSREQSSSLASLNCFFLFYRRFAFKFLLSVYKSLRISRHLHSCAHRTRARICQKLVREASISVNLLIPSKILPTRVNLSTLI